MSLVFSAERKSVSFDWIFEDGQKERFTWREMSPRLAAEFSHSTNDISKALSLAKDILLDSVDHEDQKLKKRLIKEILEKMGVNSLFSFIETLNNAVSEEQGKK